MKKLMFLDLVYGPDGAPSMPTEASFLPLKIEGADSFDWREEVRAAAPQLGWDLKEEDLVTVRSMIEYLMKNHGSYPYCICRDDVQLPGGAVLMDSVSSGTRFPLCIIWEEECSESAQ